MNGERAQNASTCGHDDGSGDESGGIHMETWLLVCCKQAHTQNARSREVSYLSDGECVAEVQLPVHIRVRERHKVRLTASMQWMGEGIECLVCDAPFS